MKHVKNNLSTCTCTSPEFIKYVPAGNNHNMLFMLMITLLSSLPVTAGLRVGSNEVSSGETVPVPTTVSEPVSN